MKKLISVIFILLSFSSFGQLSSFVWRNDSLFSVNPSTQVWTFIETNVSSAPPPTFLPSDVVNAEVVANTLTDITGLSFPVTAGNTYEFSFWIVYNSAATTTGSRFTISGPSTTFLNYTSEYPLTATSKTFNTALAGYNLPAASNASSLTTNNICQIKGRIKPSANGTVQARFASEITLSAITVKAGGQTSVEFKQIQ